LCVCNVYGTEGEKALLGVLMVRLGMGVSATRLGRVLSLLQALTVDAPKRLHRPSLGPALPAPAGFAMQYVLMVGLRLCAQVRRCLGRRRRARAGGHPERDKGGGERAGGGSGGGSGSAGPGEGGFAGLGAAHGGAGPLGGLTGDAASALTRWLRGGSGGSVGTPGRRKQLNLRDLDV
jgi:hypothetical protein